jgi:predicted phosphoribosyltransferase
VKSDGIAHRVPRISRKGIFFRSLVPFCESRKMIFRDRIEAGQLLGMRLKPYANANPQGIIVLALPRGGVPIGLEVARALNAPLDVFLVRKLGAPGQEELAIGAISSGGVRLLNQETIRTLGISQDQVETITRREAQELERRELLYRGKQDAPEIRGKTAILVDDGLATGLTMRSAIEALRQKEPNEILVAVPVASAAACREVEKEADTVLCLHTPPGFFALGQWYQDFSQVGDAAVREMLDQAKLPPYKAPR